MAGTLLEANSRVDRGRLAVLDDQKEFKERFKPRWRSLSGVEQGRRRRGRRGGGGRPRWVFRLLSRSPEPPPAPVLTHPTPSEDTIQTFNITLKRNRLAMGGRRCKR
jgi:hypothetical protein